MSVIFLLAKREERHIPGRGNAFLVKILFGKIPEGKDPGWILYFNIQF